MCPEIGCFTSEIEKNTSEIIFFLAFSVYFLGQVIAIVADVEPRKVKRYLFSQGADLTFWGSAQGVFNCKLCWKEMYRTLLATCE